MPTFSITTPTQAKKTEVQERFKKWKDMQPGDPSMFIAFEALLDLGEQGIESLQSKREPASVQFILDKISCPFLEYETYDFKCFEFMDKKKKPDILGTDPEKVLVRCNKCKEGKAQKILEQYQKKLRGQNIRGIVQMIRTFETFAEQGVPSTIYFCNRIKGKQIMTGKKNITCTKHDARVPIDPTCIDPPCPHFETYTITVEQEFPKEALALIEGIAEDYERLENLSPGERKEVDAEQGQPEGDKENES